MEKRIVISQCFLEGRYRDTYEKRSAQETIANEEMLEERGFNCHRKKEY